MTMTDDKSTWLHTGPLTAADREATIASLRDGDLSPREAAGLLGCTEAEALAATLPTETAAANRLSYTDQGGRRLWVALVTAPDRSGYEVPTYFVRRGHSVDDAARSLGLRALSRRELVPRTDVVAEIREVGGGWAGARALCVREVQS